MNQTLSNTLLRGITRLGIGFFLFLPLSVFSSTSCPTVQVISHENTGISLALSDIASQEHYVVRVADTNPLNGAQIDQPGAWTYGVFDQATGTLVCWGSMSTEHQPIQYPLLGLTSKDHAKNYIETKVNRSAHSLQFSYSGSLFGSSTISSPFDAADCSASFGIDRASLKDYFGIEIKDNCSDVSLNVDIESCVPELLYGFPVSEPDWRPVSYSRMTINGRLMVVGVPVGKHRLIITATDACGNQKIETFHFVVADKIAPVMKCDDALQVTLSNTQSNPYGQNVPTQGYSLTGYAKVWVSDINEGSWDNCGLEWMRVRRAYNLLDEAAYVALGYDWNKDGEITLDGSDGVDWNSDGDIDDELETFEKSKVDETVWMTPALDYVEFFCTDLNPSGVVVELWGKDKTTLLGAYCPLPDLAGGAYPTSSGGNLGYCWQTVYLEDNVYPTFVAPWPAEILCTDRQLLDSLSQERTVSLTSSTYAFIEEHIFTPQDKGAFTVLSGDDCNDLSVSVSIVPVLHCDAGTVTLTYTATKRIKGKDVVFAAKETTISVRPIHAYNLQFPKDEVAYCAEFRDTANVADGGELGCDVLAVHISDKRYNGAVINGKPSAECYKIFRTFTVVNWCQYTEACGEPMQWAVIVPRDPDGDGFNGVNVLVRSAPQSEESGVYYEDAKHASGTKKRDLTAQSGELVTGSGVHNNNGRVFQFNNTVGGVAGTFCPSASDLGSGLSYFAWMFTQHIYVHDTIAPQVADPGVQRFVQNKNTCATEVRIPISAEDECAGVELQQAPTTADNLAIERVRIRLNGGAPEDLGLLAEIIPNHTLSGDEKGNGQWIFRAVNIPLGEHSLLVSVRDDCGNVSAQREIPFSVVDTTGPTPICHHGVMTMLAQNPQTRRGEALLWASDLVASPIDDCNGQGPTVGPTQKPLVTAYYLVKDNGDRIWDAADGLDSRGYPKVKQEHLTLTCQDALQTQVMVRLYAEDQFGNMGFCETYVVVGDPDNTCVQGVPSAISGVITTETGTLINQVEVQLSGGASMQYMTDNSGRFNFTGLNEGMNYSLTPERDYDFANGVSTYDLALLSRHILGIQPLTSPYRLIAADINHSGTVSTADLLELRKMILGLASSFTNNTSWRFVDAAFQFPNPENPWQTPFPEVIHCAELHGEMQVSFIGIKIGDLNGNALAQSSSRSAAVYELETADQLLAAGNIYRIPLRGKLDQTAGFQATLTLSGVDILDVEPGVIQEEQVAVFSKEKALTISWNNLAGVGSSGNQALLTLVVRANTNTTLREVLHLNSRITRAEAYSVDGEVRDMQLQVTAIPTAPGAEYELMQNIPNPFTGETVIGFRLPEAAEVTVRIQDVMGRTLHTIKGRYPKGANQVYIHGVEQDLLPGDQASGVLYYTLTTGSFTATRKMIYLGQ